MLRSISSKSFREFARTSWNHLGKQYIHAPVAFDWEDPLDSASLFTTEELAIQETARSYCQEYLLPRVLGM